MWPAGSPGIFFLTPTAVHGTGQELRCGWGESWDSSEQLCAASDSSSAWPQRRSYPTCDPTPASGRKVASQGSGVTDLELAFSQLRLRKVQLVLPEPCRCQGSQSVQPGWQRWADTCGAGEEPCASPGSCWLPIPCNPASMGSPHLPPAGGTRARAWNTPSCPPPASSVCPQSSGVGCTRLCSSTSPTAG